MPRTTPIVTASAVAMRATSSETRAVEHAGEDVLADRVDAEEERRRGPGRRPENRIERARVLGIRRMRDRAHDQRSEQREEDLEDDEPERDERHPVLPELPPEELPRCPRDDLALRRLDAPRQALFERACRCAHPHSEARGASRPSVPPRGPANDPLIGRFGSGRRDRRRMRRLLRRVLRLHDVSRRR
jgi:hypothetical protein